MRRRARRIGDTGRGLIAPEEVERDGVILRRLTADDAPAVSKATTESLEHLRPWMPWATPEGTSLETQRERLLGPATLWNSGSGYEYGIFLPDGSLVGGCGLHRRIGPSALEIGYWVHVDHTRPRHRHCGGRRADGGGIRVARHRAHGDPLRRGQRRQRLGPPKLGYRLTGRLEHEPEAPGEMGSRLIWVLYRREWESRPPRPSPTAP